MSGRKSYWTKKYPPISILDAKSLGIVTLEEAEEYENKVVRKYMRKKGINNVRGGDLLQTDDFVVRFGYLFDRFGWESLMYIAVSLLFIMVLIFDKYF